METVIPELKKLEQNNNVTLIKEEIKNILKKLSKKRENKAFFEQIRPLMKEMNMFIIPDWVFTLLQRFFHITQVLDPLVHPKEIYVPSRHISAVHISAETAQKEYESIQDNKHIHTFLRKKYRAKISSIFQETTQKYYIYTLFRERRTVMVIKKTLKNIQKIATLSLLLTIIITCFMVFSPLYSTVFITTNTLIIFIILLSGSLVIQSETV